MKKMLSILLCLAMVLSLAAVTFAAADTDVVVNEVPQLGENNMMIPGDDPDAQVTVEFTAPEAPEADAAEAGIEAENEGENACPAGYGQGGTPL